MVAQIELHLNEDDLEHQQRIESRTTIAGRQSTGGLVPETQGLKSPQLLFDDRAERFEIDKLFDLP